MASIGFLIGGALVNALQAVIICSVAYLINVVAYLVNALQEVIICSVAYLKNQLIKNERDMIRPSKIYKELKWNGLEKDKNDWITLIMK